MQRSGGSAPTLAGVRERSISEASSSDESMGGNAKLSGMLSGRPECVDSERWIDSFRDVYFLHRGVPTKDYGVSVLVSV